MANNAMSSLAKPADGRLFAGDAQADLAWEDADSQLQSATARALAAEVEYIQLARTLAATAKILAERRESDQRTLVGLARAASYAWNRRFSLRQMLGDLFVAARRRRLRPLRSWRLFEEIRLIRASGLIDPEFYAPQKAGAQIPTFEDARHYVLVGRNLDPNRLFCGAAYLKLNPDVRGAEMTPLAHFIRYGAAEGRPFDLPSDLAPVEVEDRPRYEWPLASGRAPGTLHDLRPDDQVLAEGDAGRAFLAEYDLLGSNPDFSGAVECLQRMEPASQIAGPGDPPPTASIIIPVYGQLAYTLNCLHSLLAHRSRVSFEILIGDDASPDQSERFLSQIPHVRYLRHAANSGFVDNCNSTAASARGDYIVLLNNDTRVVPGWLDELIGSFSLFPKAGLVGSKLFYDDGSLQEAGGIFWRDGSAWNYGREDDPNRPRYCYARQVDYVSGASIAVPAALWRELKGFDEIYRPAYAEDADLAFRIRAMGRETWMQPQSRVIHYEGRTSGTDLTQGVKAYQVDNVRKLAVRWAEALSAHRPNGEAPMFERERHAKKRVLVIDAVTPTPNEDAGSVLTVTHIRLYQELGYKVHFIPLHNFLYQRKSTDELLRMGVECAYHPYEPSLEPFLRRYGRYLDVVQIFRVAVAEEALQLLRRYAPQAAVIFHNVDMHYLRMERQAAVEGDGALLDAAKAMKARELKLIGDVDCTIVLSDVEEDILKVETPDADVVVFPYMTPVMGTRAGFSDRRDVMFLGGYRHPPNVDSALFLAHKVWPLVRERLPVARLVLVGANAPQEVKDLASEDIIVAGQVDDLRPCFDRARVFAAAIRYGAGIKGKVATAMSYGVPVVATTIAAEGMFLVDGRDVRIADDPQEIARAIVDLYENPVEWARYSANGMAFVAENNSMDMGRRMLTNIIQRAAYRHARRTADSPILKAILAGG